MFALGLLNTTWIYLYSERENQTNAFLNDFRNSLIFDFLVYEVIIVTTKAMIYFYIVKTNKISRFKKCLIITLSLLPWVSF